MKEIKKNCTKRSKKEQKLKKISLQRTMMGRGKKETITVVIVPWKAAS
jgi:hypothetical protein